MKKILIVILIISSLTNLHSQEYKTKQNLTFLNSSKKTVVIPEFLVKNIKTNNYEPYQISLKDFYDYRTNPLGIRYFNFGCIKTKRSGFWPGQIDLDKQRHAIFKEPLYGIRTMVIMNAELVEKRNNNTLIKFFNVYAPSNDCVGGIKNDNGTCKYGFNKPEKYAKKVGDAIGIGINEIINLRDNNGEINIKLMTLLISEVAKFETGKDCKFTEETVKKAIELDSNVVDIDNFIKENLPKYSSWKKYQVGKGTGYSCGYKEIFFVERYNADKEIKERFMVYNKNGKFIKSTNFIKWCANQVGYLDSAEFNDKAGQIEHDKAIENLIISFKEENITEFTITFKQNNDAESSNGKYVTFVHSNDLVSFGFPSKEDCD